MPPKVKDQTNELRIQLDKIELITRAAVAEARREGFDEGIKKTPDFKAFKKQHTEPQYYGEDGEIVVISGHLSESTAVSRIYSLLKDDVDIERSDIEGSIRCDYVARAGPDEEYDYVVGNGRSGVFPAWVWFG